MHNAKAFSLIEVLISVAIIAILAVVSWQSLGDAKQRTQLDNECKNIASLVNKARGYALSGRVVDSNVPSDFSVSCSASACSLKGGSSTLETYDLMGGVSIKTPAVAQFSVPSGTGGSVSMEFLLGSSSRSVMVAPYQSAFCQ